MLGSVYDEVLDMLSSLAAAHIQSPRNVGPLRGATHIGMASKADGVLFINFWFKVSDGIIEAAAYRSTQCQYMIACASITAQILVGRTVGRALSLEVSDLQLLIGVIPEEKAHCPAIAIEALLDALASVE